MTDAIEVFLNISTPQGAIVKGLSDTTQITLGPFYQGQLLKFRFYPVVPTGNQINAPYFSLVPLSGLELYVVAGPRAGAQALLASQPTWAKQSAPDSDGKSGYFYADFDLNTTEMNTAVGTNDSIATFFEIQMSRGGAFAPVFQTSITVLSVVKDPSGAASIPTPAASYYTAAQLDAMFVRWDNRIAASYGKTPIFVSPDGSHTREAPGVDNDGNPTDYLT